MIAYLQARAKTWKRWQQMLSRQKWLSLRRNCSARRSETGFFSCGMVFVCATAFHGAMILVCETKTRFLMPCLSSYVFRMNWVCLNPVDDGRRSLEHEGAKGHESTKREGHEIGCPIASRSSRFFVSSWSKLPASTSSKCTRMN